MATLNNYGTIIVPATNVELIDTLPLPVVQFFIDDMLSHIQSKHAQFKIEELKVAITDILLDLPVVDLPKSMGTEYLHVAIRMAITLATCNLIKSNVSDEGNSTMVAMGANVLGDILNTLKTLNPTTSVVEHEWFYELLKTFTKLINIEGLRALHLLKMLSQPVINFGTMQQNTAHSFEYAFVIAFVKSLQTRNTLDQMYPVSNHMGGNFSMQPNPMYNNVGHPQSQSQFNNVSQQPMPATPQLNPFNYSEPMPGFGRR